MIPETPQILSTLVEYAADLSRAAKRDDATEFFRTLSNIERLAAYHKVKLTQHSIVDPEDEDDDL